MDTAANPTAKGAWPRAVVVYLAVAALVCFAWLGTTDVISMEGIVADVTRHMDRTGEILLPRLYGELYTYKSPLTYWLALASRHICGVESEWSLRFPVALSGLLMGLAALVLVGRIAGPTAGCFTAIAALTGALVLQKVRMAEYDMPLAASVGVAVAAACHNLAAERPRAWIWLLASGGLTFGLLAKGLPALLLFAPGLLLASLLTRRVRRLWSWSHVLAVALCAVVIGVYGLAVYHAGGAAAFAQPLAEARYRGTAWTARDLAITVAKPLVVLVVFLPWSALLPLAASAPLWQAQDRPTRHLLAAAIGFLLAGILALMAVPTYQTRYFLPLCVPVGIIAGIVATSPVAETQRWSQIRAGIARIGTMVAGLLALAAGLQTAVYRLPTDQRVLLVGLGLVALLGALRAATPRTATWPARLLTIAALCVWATLTLVDGPQRAEKRSLRSVAQAFDAHLPPGAAVWLDMDDDQSSLIYYLRRPAQTFRRAEAWPPAHSYVVLFPQQIQELETQPALTLVQLARARGAGLDFVLGRLEARPAVSPATSSASVTPP